MLENQKVYVKATYLGGNLHSVFTTFNIVMRSFLDDENHYRRMIDDYDCSIIGDKLIVKVKDANITYELFICNFNEISNYLH